MVQEVLPSRWSVFGQSGYANFSTSVASISGIGVGVGTQYQMFGRGQIGINWMQVLGSDSTLTALYSAWSIEAGWRLLGGNKTELHTIKVDNSETIRQVERTARSALSAVLQLKQINLSTSSGGTFSGAAAGLLYEYGVLRTAWLGSMLTYSSVKNSSQSASEMQISFRLRFPLQLKF